MPGRATRAKGSLLLGQHDVTAIPGVRVGAWEPPQRPGRKAMTKKKDLKKRVRERQARTKESYTTALAHVLSGRPAVEEELVVEMIDLTAEAERLAIRCHARAWPELIARVD